jgi:hypothetical protein
LTLFRAQQIVVFTAAALYLVNAVFFEANQSRIQQALGEVRGLAAEAHL